MPASHHAAVANPGGRASRAAGKAPPHGLRTASYRLSAEALRGTFAALRLTAGTVCESLPRGAGRLRARELQNKLEVFDAFHHAEAHLGLLPGSPGRGRSWHDVLARLAAWPPHPALFALEGLGHALAGARGLAPDGLLAGLDREGVPPSRWIPLHTGLGLALAGSTPWTLLAGRRLDDALERFIGLCHHHARPGYARAVFEALGFVGRTLHPGAVARLDGSLSRELKAFFWHGVGRGLYFSPENAVPGRSPAAVAAAWREPPHELGRRNALAGVAWAATLVNLRHPEVVESLFDRSFGALDDPAREAALGGAASAAFVWADVYGESHPLLTAFLRASRVRDPFARARHRRRRRTGRPDEIFADPP